MKRILTWIKPTGAWMHLWNYLWMFVPLIEMSKWKDTYLMIADFHSLTSVHEWDILKSNKRRMLCEIFSLLPKDVKITVFEQSKMPHNDITWILSSVTPYSLMLRAHSFKDSKEKNKDINMATFNYPILMASDILAYDTDLVPVWKDQKQHLEFTRDIASNFNNRYNIPLFKIPEAYITQEVWLIPWTDGRKMSKSYNNHIAIFDDNNSLKNKISSIVTWSESLEEPKDPEKCSVFNLIKLFADEKKTSEIRDKYKKWNYWYGHAKKELLEILENQFKEARENYNYYMDNYPEIEKKLEDWNNKAKSIADLKYKKLLETVWL